MMISLRSDEEVVKSVFKLASGTIRQDGAFMKAQVKNHSGGLMFSRKSLLLIAAVVFPTTFTIAAVALAADAKKVAYKADPKASQLSWVGKKVTGEHTGTVPLKSGELVVAGGNLVGGKFVVDTANLVNTDLEGEYKGKLEGHLKSADFFGVDKYPTSAFEITKVEPASGEGDATHKITGNLTIKDKTNPVSFPAKVTVTPASVTAAAKGVEIDRTLYGIRYGSGKFFENLGDKTIYDTFTMDISIVAKK
jgi:polyisoprenoid-binding protein YceI